MNADNYSSAAEGQGFRTIVPTAQPSGGDVQITESWLRRLMNAAHNHDDNDEGHDLLDTRRRTRVRVGYSWLCWSIGITVGRDWTQTYTYAGIGPFYISIERADRKELHHG